MTSEKIGSRKKLVRQAKFRADGTVTDVPARDSERPQLEMQGDLFLFSRERALYDDMNTAEKSDATLKKPE